MSAPPAIAVRDNPAFNDCWNRIGVWGDRSCPELVPHVHCRNCPVYATAALALLDGERSAETIADATAHFARKSTAADPDTQSVVLFRLDDEWLALPIAAVKEVATLRTIHSLPHRRDGLLLGLVNVRGELLVCVSLRRMLQFEKTAEPSGEKAGPGHQRRLLVISRDGHRLVVPVDEVHGLRHHAPGELKPVPATVARATATYTKAMLPWRDKAVGCLDDQLLFYTLNRSLA